MCCRSVFGTRFWNMYYLPCWHLFRRRCGKLYILPRGYILRYRSHFMYSGYIGLLFWISRNRAKSVSCRL